MWNETEYAKNGICIYKRCYRCSNQWIGVAHCTKHIESTWKRHKYFVQFLDKSTLCKTRYSNKYIYNYWEHLASLPSWPVLFICVIHSRTSKLLKRGWKMLEKHVMIINSSSTFYNIKINTMVQQQFVLKH